MIWGGAGGLPAEAFNPIRADSQKRGDKDGFTLTLPKERIKLVCRQCAQTSESSFVREASTMSISSGLQETPAGVSGKSVALLQGKR